MISVFDASQAVSGEGGDTEVQSTSFRSESALPSLHPETLT